MKSIGQMVMQLAGLVGTNDATEWEAEFITSILEQTNQGRLTVHLTGKQTERILSIWEKHFA